MFDVNVIPKVESIPTKKLVVYSPEQCPFRTIAPWHDGEADYCGYLKSLHKMVVNHITFDESTYSFEDDADAFCCCTDEQWLEGCPLLKDSFIVVKN